MEVGSLLAAPLVCFWALHLRAMAPPGLPDPAMHSVYLWDPRDVVTRYAPQVFDAARRAYVGPPAAYFRWGARPGFLVPGRLAFLALGAVPGFFAFRYALALVATLPVYLLAKRLWGTWAGVLGVLLVLTSPVIITAWGTDFPDSAAVSYLLGGGASLVVPARSRRERNRLLAVAVTLLTLAVWSLATTALLVGIALVVWGVHGALRSASELIRDLIVLASAATASTLALAVGSWLVLGRFDFVLPTIRASRFLATPAQERLWHSSDPRWALSDAYLLVLPAVALAWIAVVVARRRPGDARTLIGLTFILQLAAATFLQFAGRLQLLEEHYLSSSLWAASTLALLVVLSELSLPLADRAFLRFLPAASVAAIALVSEAAPAPPPLGWAPWGYLLAGAAVAVALAGSALATRLTGAAATAIITAALLALTVIPSPRHPNLGATVYDPPTGYDRALGSGAGRLIDDYRIEHATRAWVPDATYRGEQLVTCIADRRSTLLMDVAALFHASDDLLAGTCPRISPSAVREIVDRRAAQLLVVGARPLRIATTLRRLRPLAPVVARRTELRAGPVSCWLWLIEVPRYRAHHAI